MEAIRRFRLTPVAPRARNVENHVRLMATGFREAAHPLRFGMARLFGDRIELTSYRVLGPRTRRIRLDRIAQMDYHPLREGSNLSLYLVDGEVLHLRVGKAHAWRAFFENWLRYDVLPSAKLLRDPGEALAVSG